MKPLRILVVGYGDHQGAQPAPAARFFRGALFRAAVAWAEAERRQGRAANVLILSDWVGLAPCDALLYPSDDPPLAWRPGAAQDEWAAQCVAGLLGHYRGAPLLLEVHTWLPVARLLSGWSPRVWQVEVPYVGRTSPQRLAHYHRRLKLLGVTPPEGE